ncbi:MAG: PilZ domain-containing protein [Desulfobulbaceae bacterium]|nr:PilZ domain-containing protein [Desulfobulbaceae bacterium]
MTPTETTERRQSIRKNVKSGIIALLQPGRPIEIGNVIDISHNGLSFTIDNDKYNSDIKKPVKMDIFLMNENIFLEHVTTSVVSERIWQDDPQLNKYQAASRYGVKFVNLESSQEGKLRELTAEASA